MSIKPTYEELERRIRDLENMIDVYRRHCASLIKNDNDVKAILNATTETIVVLDRAGTVVTVNRTCCERLGVAEKDLIGRCIYDFFSPDVAAARRKEYGEVFDTRIPKCFVDSRIGLIFEQSIYPVFDDHGRVEKIAVFARDGTKQRRYEEQLTLFKEAVAMSSDAIGMSTPEGLHWYQNEAFDSLFGAIGEDPPASLYVDEPVGRKVFEMIKAGGRWTGEVEMYGKDGAVRSVWLRAYAIKNENGRVLGLVGAHTDMTDRKHSEEALRKSEENLKAVFAAVPDPLVIYDPTGAPEFVNPAFTGVFGWTLDELKGKRIPFVPEDQKEVTQQGISMLYGSGAPVRLETRRLTKDGRKLDVIISAAFIKGADGKATGMVVNLTDITERKKLQSQFERAQKMEAIGTLAGGIAHDFNNLLMGIQGRASLIALELGPSHPLCGQVREIEAHVQSAGGLTQQLLGFAKGGKYEVRPIDINEVMEKSVVMFGRTRKEILVHAHPHPAPLVVEADRRQIEQVLLNLYLNAWQAMPEGGELFLSTRPFMPDEAFCKVHQVRPAPYARVSVTDTGIGMNEATIHRIFDPFFTTREKGRGTGLGLASAYGIIKNHGGLITVYSEPGKGTTFNVYLPLSEKPAHAETPTGASLLRGTETILLVDDEEMIREVGRAMLEKLGYRVLTAGSGRQALEVIAGGTEEIHLVVLDMIMPIMDGGKAFDEIRRLRADMKVLLSSGYAVNGQAGDILRRGCNGFIQKPFNLLELSRKIRLVLEEKKS